MDGSVKQQHRSSTYNHAAATTTSTKRDRICRKTNGRTTRSLSSNNVLVSMSREKSTLIRKNEAPVVQQPGRTSHQIDIASNVSGTQHCSSNQQQQQYGYVGGDFASGQIYKLQLRDRSYCHSYNYYGDILVVGTATSLDFYDATTLKDHTNNCNQYSIIISIPHTAGGGMISAITWIAPTKRTTSSASSSSFNAFSDSHEMNINDYNNYYSNKNNNDVNQQLLALSDLNGRIYLYSINPDILESQGPTLIYNGNNRNGTQIRSLAAGYFSGTSLVIAAGDKSGCVTLVTFLVSTAVAAQQVNFPVYIDTKQFSVAQQQEERNLKELYGEEKYNNNGTNQNSSCGVLGIAFEFRRGMMAICTSSGLVQVFSLSHLLSFGTNNTPTINDNHHDSLHSSKCKLLWSTQNINASAVRCIIFGPNDTNTLIYGGYDKTIIMVDIDRWTTIRELHVQGTVGF